MRAMTIPMVVVGALTLGACENLSPTEQRVGGGAAGGAALGALTAEDKTTGALVGGALGAGAGYLYDRYREGELTD